MAQSYFLSKRTTSATFDLFVRQLPAARNYLVAAGLEDILGYVRSLRFGRDDISFLKKQRLFSCAFLKYLGNFQFSGDIWAMREGEVFFANEPVIRVTAPIIEGQLLESFFLNTVNLQTMLASKASRVVNAAGRRGVFDFSLRRTHGKSAALSAARSSYIAGAGGTSNCLAGTLYNIPVSGTMAHSFVVSFKSEKESFLAYSRAFPRRTILLVDTYDTKRGVLNAIDVGVSLKKSGYKLVGIRLDSGDIVAQSKYARRLLDKAGLAFVKIFASGSLDEYKIKKIIEEGGRVDNFGVGTNMGASVDAPSLDVIYKLGEVTDEAGEFLPTMKLSVGKVTYPGRKQVFRLRDRSSGFFARDILALEGEKVSGRPLLEKVISRGRVIYRPPSLGAIRDFSRRNLRLFPPALRRVDRAYQYPVVVSAKLKDLKAALTAQLSLRQ